MAFWLRLLKIIVTFTLFNFYKPIAAAFMPPNTMAINNICFCHAFAAVVMIGIEGSANHELNISRLPWSVALILTNIDTNSTSTFYCLHNRHFSLQKARQVIARGSFTVYSDHVQLSSKIYLQCLLKSPESCTAARYRQNWKSFPKPPLSVPKAG